MAGCPACVAIVVAMRPPVASMVVVVGLLSACASDPESNDSGSSTSADSSTATTAPGEGSTTSATSSAGESTADSTGGDSTGGVPACDGIEFAITAVNGPLDDRADLTVHGCGFGIKDPVEPLIWDDFEDGESDLGALIADVDAKWTTSHDSFAYDDTWSHSGSVSARSIGTGGFHNIYPAQLRFTDTLYMSGWLRTEGWDTSDVSSEFGLAVKFFRMNNSEFGAPPSYNGPLGHNFGWRQFSSMGDPEQPSSFSLFLQTAADDDGTVGSSGYHGDTPWSFNAEPVRVEYFAALNTPGVADGYSFSRHIGWGEHENETLMQREAGSTLQLDVPYFQLSAANTADAADFDSWGDDFYADVTQARVELGDAPVFSDCTHREIQIPHSTWDEQTVQITFNRGTFESGRTVYLFVITEDGRATDGFPIEL